MKLALLADVHANVPALTAVLRAISRMDVDWIVCLGDLVGYNAEPAAAVELVRRHAALVVGGNHDRDVALGRAYPGTTSVAARIAAWTRERLDEEQLSYLASLPDRIVVPGTFVAVHGCYLSESTHATGYVTSTTLELNLRAIADHEAWPKLAFCGHTHSPVAAWLDASGCTERPLRGTERWPAGARAVLINPGSVGQPRDGDPRASFAVVDPAARTATVHRIAYDVERAIEAIREADLPAVLGERLREGR